MVSEMTTSGCENSEAREGESLPTKGTARRRREMVSVGSCCSSVRMPKATRLILVSTKGTMYASSSCDRLSILSSVGSPGEWLE
eukprot:scaffold14728_cov48-Phaeocystis_antarctica.AAC.1